MMQAPLKRQPENIALHKAGYIAGVMLYGCVPVS